MNHLSNEFPPDRDLTKNEKLHRTALENELARLNSRHPFRKVYKWAVGVTNRWLPRSATNPDSPPRLAFVILTDDKTAACDWIAAHDHQWAGYRLTFQLCPEIKV